MTIAILFLFIETQAVTPVADFSANNLTICTGLSTTFSNTSTGTITNYSWNFGPGASPATANTAGPHTVTYSTGGAKTISLTVSGPDGSSVKTKTNYITVGFDRFKIMSYNLLNYPSSGTDSTTRNPWFRTIVSSADPDILVVEELLTVQGMNGFLSHVMNASGNIYSAGTFINGFDSDNGIFFKSSRFTFVSNTPIHTELRDINEFKLVHNLSGDTLRIYALHLKANPGSPDDAQRGREVDSLRKVTNALPAGKFFIVCGDFNIYNSNEIAYQKLLAVTPPFNGQFYDPLPLTGNWNNSAYAIYHTQSTRDTSLGDGGSTGGLDDRFDMMLFSNGINQSGGMTYVNGSTTAFGNDGNHYNKSVVQLPANTAVSAAVANALYRASDHLPVFAEFDWQLTNCQPMDVGVTALLHPPPSSCPSPAAPLQVQVTNYSSFTADFSINNLTVTLQVTRPNATISTYTKVISSGILAGNSALSITFDSTLNMSAPGTYVFNSTTSFPPDINVSNNAMAPVNVVVGSPGSTTITPTGPLTFCDGGSVTLTAGSGSNYQWSNGATTQSILVSSAGNYSVHFVSPGGCLVASDTLTTILQSYFGALPFFTESMGNVSTTTAISIHEAANGFDNINFFMSGTADVRNTVFNGFTSISGGANIFLTSTLGRYFSIENINTTGLNNMQISFSVQKNLTASNGSDLLVQVSSDGTNYSTLNYPLLATGSGTTAWQYVTATGSIPATANLRIRFLQNGSTTQYRIDDVSLAYMPDTPLVIALGPTNFCTGDSLTLTTANASSYLWSTGATTQSIKVFTSGNYSVSKTAINGCSATSPPVTVSTTPCSVMVNLKVYLQGFYSGSGLMHAVLNPDSMPSLCDSIALQLASSLSPFSILYSSSAGLNTDGTVQFLFPAAVMGSSFYLVLHHRNSLETWSSLPVAFNSSTVNYFFNTGASQAFGNRMADLGDGNFSVYSGDVNQDGLINLTDYNLLLNAASSFLSGYQPADLSGDYLVESTDLSLVENNQTVILSRP